MADFPDPSKCPGCGQGVNTNGNCFNDNCWNSNSKKNK